MDDLTEAIADYAAGFRTGAIDADAAAAVVDHVVDMAGCALGAADAEPCRIARSLAAEAGAGRAGASVIGLAERTTPECAAFANAAMARHLDFNDTFQGRTGGHPSDMVPGILAGAEAESRSGSSLVQGVHVAYEVFAALAGQVPLREHGIDQGAFIAPACAAGLSAALGLDRTAAANAVSLALTTTMPLRATRAGALSAWKGCATAHAAMTAVFVTRLAARGMTGPPEPFRGADGFLDRVPGPIDLAGLGRPVDGRSAVARTSIKLLPVEYGALAPVEVLLRLRPRLAFDEIETITVAAYDFLIREIGGGRGDAAQKWDPQSRETADHSLPYLLAVALADGAVTLESFRPERVRDPALRPLMAKIRIVENPEARGLLPPRQPVRITIALRGGRTIEERCEYPEGHASRPADRARIDAKYRTLAARAVEENAAERLLALLHDLPSLPDLGALTAALRAVPSGRAGAR